jgi:hypothetical protein
MTYLRIINEPTITNAPPVAQDGMEAKIGAKNTETKKARPVTIAVIPVLPPSNVTNAQIMKKGDQCRDHCGRERDFQTYH